MEFSKRKSVDDYGSVIFPVVMIMAPKTIGIDLVSVKPMAVPSYSVIYMDIETSEEKEARKALERSEARNKIIDKILKDLA